MTAKNLDITRVTGCRSACPRCTVCPFRDAPAAYQRQAMDRLKTRTVRQRAEAALAKRTAYSRRL